MTGGPHHCILGQIPGWQADIIIYVEPDKQIAGILTTLVTLSIIRPADLTVGVREAKGRLAWRPHERTRMVADAIKKC